MVVKPLDPADIVCTMWIIYDRPADDPEHFVLRRSFITRDAQTFPEAEPLVRVRTVSEARRFLPRDSAQIDLNQQTYIFGAGVCIYPVKNPVVLEIHVSYGYEAPKKEQANVPNT